MIKDILIIAEIEKYLKCTYHKLKLDRQTYYNR